MFRNALDLVPQSKVKVNDVDVGMVRDVELEGRAAAATLELRKGIELPDNARAKLRQTSLLGEKFVTLEPPAQGASSNPLQDGDVIPLKRTGGVPEVEQVLGALSLLLNGGGLAQLNTITDELNAALDGREGAARSLLRQVDTLTGRLDRNKGQIVRALDGLNRLSASLRRQEGTINATLRELPSALDSIDQQRQDLVRALQALDRLSDVGVRVIRNSEESTTAALRQLDPVLQGLADADDSLAKSVQVIATYPFIDAVVGRDPQVARNLHLGDYTNLAVVGIDLGELPGLPQPEVPEEVCVPFEKIENLTDVQLDQLCESARSRVQKCLQALAAQDPAAAREQCGGLLPEAVENLGQAVTDLTKQVCNAPESLGDLVPQQLCSSDGDGGDGGNGGGGGNPLPDLPGLNSNNDGGNEQDGGSGGLLGGLGRTPYDQATPEPARSPRGPTVAQLMQVYDPALVKLMVPGMVVTQ